MGDMKKSGQSSGLGAFARPLGSKNDEAGFIHADSIPWLNGATKTSLKPFVITDNKLGFDLLDRFDDDAHHDQQGCPANDQGGHAR